MLKQSEKKSLSDYKTIVSWLTVPFLGKSISKFWKLIFTVLRNFFFLQFSVKFKIRKIPVVHVDHPLDLKIKFTPDKVEDYLEFVDFFIRPVSLLIYRLPRSEYRMDVSDYMGRLRDCYYNASLVYRKSMSTTYRPKHVKHKGFGTIHAFDPHFLCVPSLHIVLVCLTWKYVERIIDRLGFSEETKKALCDEAFRTAVSISESVLYIKQHSVNCIPAALYLLCVTQGDVFKIEDAVRLIDALFVKCEDISDEDRRQIRSYIEFMFDRFLLEGLSQDKWIDSIVRWLSEYKSEVTEEAAVKEF